MGCVYVLEFPNGKRYVGTTSRSLWSRDARHISASPNIPLNNAIRQFGVDEANVVCESDNPLELARERERMIQELGTMFPNGLNRRNE